MLPICLSLLKERLLITLIAMQLVQLFPMCVCVCVCMHYELSYNQFVLSICSEKVEDVASKLDAIAQLLGQVFVQQLGRQLGKMCQEQSVLSIYRYNHNNIMSEQSPSPSERHHNHSCNQVLSLHLPFRQCKYWVETTQCPFSFHAGPDVIVVTVGKQLEVTCFIYLSGPSFLAPIELVFAYVLLCFCLSLKACNHCHRWKAH